MDSKSAERFRTREAARERGKRIVSPLIRYNDLGQPVCKVCEVSVKSGTLWPAHTASRQHKAAVDAFKAQAATISGRKGGQLGRAYVDSARIGASPSHDLPDDFLDLPETKRPRGEAELQGVQMKSSVPLVEKTSHGQKLLSGLEDSESNIPVHVEAQDSKQISSSKSNLPVGFFANQDDESRARGVEPVKLQIRDEYEEFQKLIAGDMQGVDVRLQEEEFEAAEEREELEQIGQRDLLDRIEILKKRRQEKLALASKEKVIQSTLHENIAEDPSYESDDENLSIDWRAKHI